ncbi:MAG TPA: DUF3299 domain-containing protein [Dokdonella sp.]|nr:DUF3299 domain-containing protein [Dokdonella sp.]
MTPLGRLLVLVAVAALAALAGCRSEHAASSDTPDATDHYAQLDWEQLIPADELENHRLAVAFAMRRIDHGSDERAAQFGSFKTVRELDGRRTELAGYVIPLETDDDGRMTDFFLVPTVGACIHVPPPPPDQTIYVHLSHAVAAPDVGEAASVKGILRAVTHDGGLASAAYSMDEAILTLKVRD